MQGSCQHWCTPFFWTLPTRIELQRRSPSVAVLFRAGRIPTTPVNGNCAESRGGHGQFAKRRTTGPCRNGRDCLNAATVLDCPLGFAMTLAGRNRTLRRMGRAKRNPSPSRAAIDGYRFRLRSLSYGGQGAPPILQIGHTRRARVTKPQNSDCPTDFVSNAFQTQSEHRAMSVSRSTCRAVPFREQDAALVQQPSS